MMDQGVAGPAQEALHDKYRQASRVAKAPSKHKARAHIKALLRRIHAAYCSGKLKLGDHLSLMYLNSMDARYVATLAAYRQLKPHQRPNARCLFGIAQSLDPWNGSGEDVYLRLKPKNGNPDSFRRILEFGIENRSLQYLVLPLLQARSERHPCQYDRRGTHAAIARVAELMARGHVCAVETDIVNCYQSFDGEKVKDRLPIPKRVTHSVIIGAALNVSLAYPSFFGPADPGVDDEDIWPGEFADARRGVPQGSATSPLAVEMLLGPLFTKLPAGGEAVGFADNFLTMAKDANDVVSMTVAFWSALKAHPAGQLRPKEPRIFEAGSPIEFLAHRLQLVDGVVQIDPTQENLEKFEKELMVGLAKIEKLSSSLSRAKQHIGELRRYVCSWTGSFKMCDGIALRRAKALNEIDKAMPIKLKSMRKCKQ